MPAELWSPDVPFCGYLLSITIFLDLSESELNNGPGMSCNIKPNYQKIDTFENEKHPKEKPKEKGIWPKIKGKFNKKYFSMFNNRISLEPCVTAF